MDIQEYLPFLIPLFLLQLVLMVTALIMIIRQQRFRYFNRIIWIVIVIILNIIGPILYFVLERR
ncbi:PLDc N-terminal domain-containing protein [Salinicoccus sp. ID82-1]|nr:PLDc N-terminal domain-containing protein [Salinicoccus sp. ID82-1]